MSDTDGSLIRRAAAAGQIRKQKAVVPTRQLNLSLLLAGLAVENGQKAIGALVDDLGLPVAIEWMIVLPYSELRCTSIGSSDRLKCFICLKNMLYFMLYIFIFYRKVWNFNFYSFIMLSLDLG